MEHWSEHGPEVLGTGRSAQRRTDPEGFGPHEGIRAHRVRQRDCPRCEARRLAAETLRDRQGGQDHVGAFALDGRGLRVGSRRDDAREREEATQSFRESVPRRRVVLEDEDHRHRPSVPDRNGHRAVVGCPSDLRRVWMAKEISIVHHADRRTDVVMPYAPGIVVSRGRLVFLSGVTAAAVYHSHPHREEEFDLPSTMREQAVLAMENLKKTLAAVRCTLARPVSATRFPTRSAALRAIALGPDGVIAGLRRGAVWAEMSTVGPDVTRELGRAVAARGATLIDAPVSGSPVTLEAGQLSFMVGGDPAGLEKVREHLTAIGPTITHVGELGLAVTMKIATNLNLAVQMLAFSEAVALAEEYGIERERAGEGLLQSGIASPMLKDRGT